MFAIYCKDVNLSGFVTGQLVHQGGIFVTTSRLDGSTTARIKLYKSKKRAEKGIRSYMNVKKDEFEVRELSDGVVQLIMDAKKMS